jgi:YD repeat-containing protein
MKEKNGLRGPRAVMYAALMLIAFGLASAGTVDYAYDEHGRLTTVTYDDGTRISYVYDDAGNRTQVTTTIAPGVPASISVPASSTTGSYTISWGAASGTFTAYELYEAGNSSFIGESLAYSGSATSAPLSGRANGTYYYRVRACNGDVCGGYRTGGNATTVTLPPGIPASITVPSSSSTGSYTISWGAASGSIDAYELYEANNSSFTGQTLVYSGTNTSAPLSGRGDGTYYYRVRACYSSACSDYRVGSNATTVVLPPGIPASISVPASSSTGSYTISWGSATGTVTAYELYEATNSGFSGQTLVYSGTGTSAPLSGRTSGTYYYRVRACNGSSCSDYRTGANGITVSVIPATPSSISGPSQSFGNFSINWSSSAGATRYELWESNFGSAYSKVYDGSNTFKSFTNKPSGEYQYKAKACNATGCSGFTNPKFVLVCNPSCSSP